MLVIRPEQMVPFQPRADDSFVARLSALVREKLGGVLIQIPGSAPTVAELAPDQLAGMVRVGIDKGRGYGFTWESTLGAFVATMFVAAPSFDRHPLVQRALKDESVEANLRMDKIWETTTAANWQSIRESYDASAWAPAQREGGS